MRVFIVLLVLCAKTLAIKQRLLDDPDDEYMHPELNLRAEGIKNEINEEENNGDYWNNKARTTIQDKISQPLNEQIAKNVILFLGDGMSIPTLAATRVYMGGEEEELSFEKFRHTALSKTYCVDYQTADSACSATAYLCGVKANYGTIGVNGNVARRDCTAMVNTSNHVYSMARLSQLKGKKTGLVTTTRVTHASPAGLYAHTANRNWESDTDVISSGVDPTVCRDIAYQLVNDEEGKNLYVILGGGRREFLPLNFTDEEGEIGERSDNVNLIEEWLLQKSEEEKIASYVWNRTELLNAKETNDYILGLFSTSHLPYNLVRDNTSVPSLAEMTEAAITVLSRNSENGYFLFVEGGRIDHAHHATRARRSLDETIEFSKAVQTAVDMTSENDTLIVVTSDHSHTMSISGYPRRYNDILTVAGTGSDDIPYLTINYANGPGYKSNTENGRYDVSQDNTDGLTYRFPGVAPLSEETHGGDDVAIFAKGPWAHLFSGVLEQNVIPHIMAYASCVNDEYSACSGSASNYDSTVLIVLIANILYFVF